MEITRPDPIYVGNQLRDVDNKNYCQMGFMIGRVADCNGLMKRVCERKPIEGVQSRETAACDSRRKAAGALGFKTNGLAVKLRFIVTIIP